MTAARRRQALMIAVGLVGPAALLVAALAEAWPVTIDDAYISYRYARNLARGLGLVYNPGEAIEGYTNFLWTVLIAAAIKLHLSPDAATKALGSASALGTLAVAWRLSARLQPVRLIPPLAPWLLASSAVVAGYAVMGLETIFFVFLVVAATWRLFEESGGPPGRFPWSGALYALAALTRPEAPLFLLIAVAALGRTAWDRQKAVPLAIVVVVAGAHLLWRHHTYGAWLPNTLAAKTGNPGGQLRGGLEYLQRYAQQGGPVVWMAVVGAVVAARRRSRLGVAVAASALAVAAYTVVVGGDWMPLWRFLAPFEPFAFVLADVGFRAAAESSPDAPAPVRLGRAGQGIRAASWAALAVLAVAVVVQRAEALRTQLRQLAAEQHGWDTSAHPLAQWLKAHEPPGLIAVGDIGYIGWWTDFPVLDILGLVDPVIAKLPGGYGTKQGPRYLDYFFAREPAYFVLISDHGDCEHPFHPSIAAVYRDPAGRFRDRYRVVHRVAVSGGYGWCIYARAATVAAPMRQRTLFDFESGFGGWEATGNAFERGPSGFAQPNQQPIIGGEAAALANSFHPLLGDDALGTVTSPPFTIDRAQLTLLVGGGTSNATRVELLVDGEVVRRASGVDSENLAPVIWDVTPFAGRRAQLRIVDDAAGPWGHILVDAVTLSDPR